MLKQITEIPAEVYALISSLVSLAIIAAKKYRAKKKKIRFSEAIGELYETLEIMKDIIIETSADRVLILSGHNSGGIPRTTSPFYVSVMHYIYRDETKSRAARDYKKLCVDAHYINMLIHAFSVGHYHFNTKAEADCQLSTYYKAEQITDSHIFFLGIEGNSMFFLSVAKTGGQFSSEDVTKIKLKSNLIADNIKA